MARLAGSARACVRARAKNTAPYWLLGRRLAQLYRTLPCRATQVRGIAVGRCDDPAHGSTHGEPDCLKICPTTTYFKSFQWRPTCDHLVAHQPQPRPQSFPGTSNPRKRG